MFLKITISVALLQKDITYTKKVDVKKTYKCCSGIYGYTLLPGGLAVGTGDPDEAKT